MSETIVYTGLIKTKYKKPGVNQYLISRQRLHEKLDSSLERKLTMLVAPAGFGKTTAVLDWLDKRRLQAAWLSVDPDDNNSITFWNYVFAALDTIVPGAAPDVKYVLQSHDMLKANIHLSVLIDHIVKVGKDILFILDDVHLITNPVIQKGLFYLISYLPSNMHLIFASRFEPELGLEKLRLKIQIKRITADDLRFYHEEICQFYKSRGFILEKDAVNRIESFTEGWIAALVAVAMSMENNMDRQNALPCLGKSIYSINWYLEEMICSWTEEKRSFAIKTSILDTLCPALCDVVTGENNGSRILLEINQQNGFLTILDSEQLQFRYHQLFRDFLQKLLIKIYPHVVSELHERAAVWYRKLGEFNQAIEHYLNAERYGKAYELMEQQLDEVGSRNDFETAFSWISRLPSALSDNSFAVARIYVLYYIEMSQFESAREWITRMETMADDTGVIDNPEQKGYRDILCNLLKAYLSIMEGNADGFISSMKMAVAANKGGFYRMSQYMDVNTADIYFYRCPCNKFIHIFDTKRDEFYKTRAAYWTMISKSPGYGALAAGEYYYENNRLKDALPHLLEAVECAQAASCAGSIVPAMVDIARIKRACGDISGAFTVLEECKKRLRDSRHHWHYSINAFITRLHLDAGHLNEADEWFNSCKFDIFTEISRVREFELIVYSRVLMLKGRYSDAEFLLNRLLIFTESRRHSKVEVLNLLAILAAATDEKTKAMDYLEASLVIGMEEGYFRSYVDELENISPLLRQYILRQRKSDSHYSTKMLKNLAKKVLRQIREELQVLPAIEQEAAALATKEMLTKQERKVLGLLLKAYTNQEIGHKLGITLRTVKAHLGNIYSKLGVKNRAECVKLVGETGILELEFVAADPLQNME